MHPFAIPTKPFPLIFYHVSRKVLVTLCQEFFKKPILAVKIYFCFVCFLKIHIFFIIFCYIALFFSFWFFLQFDVSIGIWENKMENVFQNILAPPLQLLSSHKKKMTIVCILLQLPVESGGLSVFLFVFFFLPGIQLEIRYFFFLFFFSLI